MAAVTEGEGSAPKTGCCLWDLLCRSTPPSKPPPTTPLKPPPGIFCSHQQTELATQEVKAFAGAHLGKVKASAPAFNVRNQGKWCDELEEYNVPCFGATIKKAAMQLFDSKEIRELAATLEVEIPQPTLDAFVQGKMPKVRTLLEKVQTRSDSATGRNKEAIKKLSAFVDAFENLPKGKIQSMEAWEKFVAEYIVVEHKSDWQNRLHFDHVLSNFGFEQETATALQKTDYQDGDKTVKLEEYSLRWLSKALSAFGVAGTLCDVVNLVFAMQKKTGAEIEALKKADGADSKVTAVIDEFGRKLKNKDVKGMWLPDYMVLDGEADDTLAWLLVTYAHQCCRQPPPKVLAQLPTEGIDVSKLERVEGQLKKHGVQVFRDKESTNVKNLLNNFKRILE